MRRQCLSNGSGSGPQFGQSITLPAKVLAVSFPQCSPLCFFLSRRKRNRQHGARRRLHRLAQPCVDSPAHRLRDLATRLKVERSHHHFDGWPGLRSVTVTVSVSVCAAFFGPWGLGNKTFLACGKLAVNCSSESLLQWPLGQPITP